MSRCLLRFMGGRGGDAWRLCCEPGSSLCDSLGNAVEQAMSARRLDDIGGTRAGRPSATRRSGHAAGARSDSRSRLANAVSGRLRPAGAIFPLTDDH